MYSGNIGKLARKLIQENTGTQDITNQITNYVVSNPSRFKHVSSSNNTIDIAANDTRDTANRNFNISFKKFMTNDRLINSSNSIAKGDDRETNAYHSNFSRIILENSLLLLVCR